MSADEILENKIDQQIAALLADGDQKEEEERLRERAELDFLSSYDAILVRVIKPTLESVMNSPRVRLALCLSSVGGDKKSFHLKIDCGKQKGYLIFKPDAARRIVLILTAENLYDARLDEAVPLEAVTEDLIVSKAVNFLGPLITA